MKQVHITYTVNGANNYTVRDINLQKAQNESGVHALEFKCSTLTPVWCLEKPCVQQIIHKNMRIYIVPFSICPRAAIFAPATSSLDTRSTPEEETNDTFLLIETQIMMTQTTCLQYCLLCVCPIMKHGDTLYLQDKSWCSLDVRAAGQLQLFVEQCPPKFKLHCEQQPCWVIMR